ncbi:MAG: hypothetical protein JXA18_00165 [Chitinispirillaceae bacterium]|nr:hypothetical protein [Chitinispirillaceae bacterium]
MPGESMVTTATGKNSFYAIGQRDTFVGIDENGWKFDTAYDTTTFWGWCAAIDYRIGVLSHYPFGKGCEIGFLVEFPVQMKNFRGPPLLQFDARLGLPMGVFRRMPYHHNIDLGWIVGGWVDNGWFMEYAGGLETGSFTPYGNIRVTRTPTDIFSSGLDPMDPDFLKHSNPGWNFRTCIGGSIHLPRFMLLPDFIVPELSLVYPHSLLEVPGISVHVGARWRYGL